jgi:2-C-methyl-D-erythritol 4-phosphate cytidylyltransferase
VVEDPVHTADGITAAYAMDRKQIRRMQTPQVFLLTDLLDAYDEAERRGITDAVSCASLMLTLGRPVYLTPGTEKNLKVTTPDDVDIFRALLQMEQEGTP